MDEIISKLECHLREAKEFLAGFPPEKMQYKPSENKWSKKEILGHLVDSGINNLQRFTEIGFQDNGPYRVRGYNQDELVKANNYQDASLEEILQLWTAVNKRIMRVMEKQTEDTLCDKVILVNGEKVDLRFLMKDYVDHMEHHLQQIMR